MRVRSVVLGALIYCLSLMALSNLASAREYRSREVTREFQREHPCPSTGRTRRMPRLLEGPHHAVGLRRTGRRVEHAVAVDRRREGQGPVGAEGVRALSSLPLRSLSDNHVMDRHSVVREQLDLHNNVPIVVQQRVGERDFM